MVNHYLLTKEKKFCVGCGACAVKCPTQAISITIDEIGFRYPEVDMSRCVVCGKCGLVCPCEKEQAGKESLELYAVQHKDGEVLKRSQSGGAFTLLSDIVLEKEGVCYGAVIDDNFEVKYARAATNEERDRMSESKYVQAIIEPHIYEQIEEDLKNNKIVLFSGTPCYVYMAQKIWGKYEKFICLDFICHGVPSPKVWNDYVELRQQECGELVRVKFRNQQYLKKGWHTESFFTKDKEEYISNMYAGIFYSHLAHRKNCFFCQFASKQRFSDLTMGGFLDENPLQESSEYGVSMLFINTKKGQVLFDEIKDKARMEKCDKDIKFKNQPCLYAPVKKPEQSDEFWKDYFDYRIDELLQRYVSRELVKRYHIDLGGENGDVLQLIKMEEDNCDRKRY